MITQLVLWVCFFAVTVSGFDGRLGFGLWLASMILMIIAFQLNQLINIIKDNKAKKYHPFGVDEKTK